MANVSETKTSQTANPFFYDKPRFQQALMTQYGNLRLLEKVPTLGRHRFSILVLHPHTFSAPHHQDAEVIFFIAKGKATVSLSYGEDEKSTEIQKGDIFRTPIGTSVYIINTDNQEELHVYTLLQTVSPSGDYCNFIGAAGENPLSLYRGFSSDILEAIFNAPMPKIEKVLGAQKKGSILKATEEQVKALSKHSPFSWKSNKPFNLLKKDPTYHNKHGKLMEADANDCDLLGFVDACISFIVVTAGSIMAPFHNTKATSMTMVLGGTGFFEVLYPELKPPRDIHYGRARSAISPGTGFLIPACFPVVIGADAGEDLQLLSFGLNAKGNKKFYLAGKNNVFNQMKDEAKEVSFDVPIKEIAEVFDAQQELVFFKGL